MKRNLLISALLMVMLLISSQSFGQRNRTMRQDRPANPQEGVCLNLDDLSEEQESKITELRTAQLGQRLEHRNQMDELRARKRTLQTQPDADLSAINQVIDQMSDLRSDMMKQAAAHRQQVRELLTDEQRVIFDSRTMRAGAGRGMGQGHMGGQQGRMGRGRR